MTGKIARLMALVALLALPAALSSSGPGQCFNACYDNFFPAYCGGLPPGPELQMCGDWIVEVCVCQCYPPEYCP